MWNEKANSIVLWSVTFAILVMALSFLRITLKRSLEDKMSATADYLMWTAHGIDKPEYEGNTNVAARSNAQNKMAIRQVEAHTQPYGSRVSSTQNETSAHAVVSRGSEDVLKTFDLNTVIK